ncbi:Uncharacterized protein FWK35_00023594 [Aphis craccivora]|uniref:Uncharacterized protein n=1 Tax=Aphis craccivora TaxID=307492 RepID=A0A6G0Z241_APHCR|nr:Uncharacterized protein FWK35_00023594 [Aphis craccivora]
MYLRPKAVDTLNVPKLTIFNLLDCLFSESDSLNTYYTAERKKPLVDPSKLKDMFTFVWANITAKLNNDFKSKIKLVSKSVGCQKKKPLKDEPLKLTMCISDPKKVAHYCNFKRYSSGKKRKVTKKMTPRIYSTDILGETKQNFNDNNLAIKLNDIPLSLVELKHRVQYVGSIRFISANLFISKKKKITKTSKKLKSADIFLCIALLHNDSLQTSVSQIISEAQDMPEILFKAEKFYLVILYVTIFKTKTIFSPIYNMSVDIAHFTKMVYHWKRFSKVRIRTIEEF